MARTTGWRVYGFTAPSATRNELSGSVARAPAIADAVGDRVPLEVGVVDPDRFEAGVARPPGPVDHVRDVAPGRDAQSDATCQRSHVAPFPVPWRRFDPTSCRRRRAEARRYVSGSPKDMAAGVACPQPRDPIWLRHATSERPEPVVRAQPGDPPLPGGPPCPGGVDPGPQLARLRRRGDALLGHRKGAILQPADGRALAGGAPGVRRSRLRQALDLFEALERKPYLWAIPGLSTPSDLVARLAANGFVDQGGGYDMILCRDPRELPDEPLPAGAVLERWNKPSDADRPALAVALALVIGDSFGIPTARRANLAAEIDLTLQQPFFHAYIVRIDGEPVATGERLHLRRRELRLFDRHPARLARPRPRSGDIHGPGPRFGRRRGRPRLSRRIRRELTGHAPVPAPRFRSARAQVVGYAARHDPADPRAADRRRTVVQAAEDRSSARRTTLRPGSVTIAALPAGGEAGPCRE